MKCENKTCGSDAPRLYQLGSLYVCAVCVPDTAWKEYPKWKESKARAVREFTDHQKKGKR